MQNTGEMNSSDAQPTNLAELQRRLEAGEVFSFYLGTAGHALFLDKGQITVYRQVTVFPGQPMQHFERLEDAVVTLLCGLGDFGTLEEFEEGEGRSLV